MSVLPGAFPDNVSSGVKALLEEHFQLSNAASSHNDDTADEQKFANLFTSDGTYEMAEKQSVGHKEIVSFRQKFFKNIPHREHPVVKVFTFGSDDMNLMCYGTVGLKTSGETKNMKEWAGRYEIVKTDSGSLKFKYVQIIVTETRDSEGF
ncbi:hypothetical protein BCIN_15g03980 [Botrytis cinerea B05.10]|uniref:Fungal specific transcription protein n=1 Tax=Botryotinia fuckeliana (strain B05.10) TaxID=332648 RepID=A0A384K5Q4_BOTFB|nr:hypothetical protein BCIN_15g03980 [Botrytis cinerea B05.10]ATZ57877.1 hypothetical protein BCIN_15g03980 [Botrytis cinerea B05.10]